VQTHKVLRVLVLSLSAVVREYNVWSVLSDSMVGACNVVSQVLHYIDVYNKLVFIDGRCLAADSADNCKMLTR